MYVAIGCRGSREPSSVLNQRSVRDSKRDGFFMDKAGYSSNIPCEEVLVSCQTHSVELPGASASWKIIELSSSLALDRCWLDMIDELHSLGIGVKGDHTTICQKKSKV